MAEPKETISPPYSRFWLLGSGFSLIILAITVYLLQASPEQGLNFLWSLIIPAAPIIFLLAPNLWASFCPLAILQSVGRRIKIGSRTKLSDNTVQSLQHISWGLLFVLVPARIFLFNLEAQVVLLTIPLLALVALGSGFLFDGFGGWCSGACPIRPVEMLYGQYNQERHRPEACQSCNNCQKECSRLYSSSNEVKINNMLPFQNQIFSFPGFILGYFLSSSTDSIAMVYLKCLGIALLSWLVIRVLFNGRKGVIISGILAIGVYYGFTVPSVVGVWDLPILTIPLLYGILIALFFWGIRGFITKTLAKTS